MEFLFAILVVQVGLCVTLEGGVGRWWEFLNLWLSRVPWQPEVEVNERKKVLCRVSQHHTSCSALYIYLDWAHIINHFW